MKKFAEVAVRIFALYFFMKLVGSISSIVSLIGTMPDTGEEYLRSGIISIVLAVFVNTAMTVLLWVFSKKIARLIVGDEEESQIHINLKYHDVLIVSIKVVGLILVIISIEEAIYGVVNMVGINMLIFDIRQSSMMLLNFLFPFIKIGMGVILITSNKLHEKIGIIKDS